MFFIKRDLEINFNIGCNIFLCPYIITMDNNQREELLAMLQGTMDENYGSGLVGGKKRKKVKAPNSKWIKYVKEYAKKHKKSYAEALTLAGPSFRRKYKGGALGDDEEEEEGGAITEGQTMGLTSEALLKYTDNLVQYGKSIYNAYKTFNTFTGGATTLSYQRWLADQKPEILKEMSEEAKKRQYAIAKIEKASLYSTEDEQFYRTIAIKTDEIVKNALDAYPVYKKNVISKAKLDTLNQIRTALSLPKLTSKDIENLKGIK